MVHIGIENYCLTIRKYVVATVVALAVHYFNIQHDICIYYQWSMWGGGYTEGLHLSTCYNLHFSSLHLFYPK